MKKLFILITFVLLSVSTAFSLAPVRIAIGYTAGSGVPISVELYDYSSNTPPLYTQSMGTLTANSSGIISFVISGTAWDNISASTINSNVVVNVKTGQSQTLYAQYRLDELILLQAQTGTGVAQENGSGAFILDDANSKVYNSNSNFDLIFGDDDFDYAGPSGTEAKLYFKAIKGAIRAGGVSDDSWDNSNVGVYSTAFGQNTKATDNSATAFGNGTTASGLNSTAMGQTTIASGKTSVAMGLSSEATASYSVSIGHGTHASGESSVSMGEFTTASGLSSIATGSYTIADGDFSVAMGRYNDNTITDELLTVGNGTADNLRSNALEVYMNGDVWSSGFIKNKITTASNLVELAAAKTSIINYTYSLDVANSNLPITATDGTILYVNCENALNDFLGTPVSANEVVTCLKIGGVWHRIK